MKTLEIKDKVIIQKETDGWRAYWLHRSWDCMGFESTEEKLRIRLERFNFQVVEGVRGYKAMQQHLIEIPELDKVVHLCIGCFRSREEWAGKTTYECEDNCIGEQSVCIHCGCKIA